MDAHGRSYWEGQDTWEGKALWVRKGHVFFRVFWTPNSIKAPPPINREWHTSLTPPDWCQIGLNCYGHSLPNPLSACRYWRRMVIDEDQWYIPAKIAGWGLYAIFGDTTLLYIGESTDIGVGLRAHIRHELSGWEFHGTKRGTITVAFRRQVGRHDILTAKRILIERLKPYYNSHKGKETA